MTVSGPGGGFGSNRPKAQRLITVQNPEAEVVVFMNADGSAEAVITNPERPKHPTRHYIAKPPAGMRIVFTRYPTGEAEVVYRSESNG